MYSCVIVIIILLVISVLILRHLVILGITIIWAIDYTYIETLWGYRLFWLGQHKSEMFLMTPELFQMPNHYAARF